MVSHLLSKIPAVKFYNGASEPDGPWKMGNNLSIIVLWDLDNVKPLNELFEKPNHVHRFLENHFHNEGFTGLIRELHVFGFEGDFKKVLGFKDKELISYRVDFHPNTEEEELSREPDATDRHMDDWLKSMIADYRRRGNQSNYNIVSISGDHFFFSTLLDAKLLWNGALIVIASSCLSCAKKYTRSSNVDVIHHWMDDNLDIDLERLRVKQLERRKGGLRSALKKEIEDRATRRLYDLEHPELKAVKRKAKQKAKKERKKARKLPKS